MKWAGHAHSTKEKTEVQVDEETSPSVMELIHGGAETLPKKKLHLGKLDVDLRKYRCKAIDT